MRTCPAFAATRDARSSPSRIRKLISLGMRRGSLRSQRRPLTPATCSAATTSTPSTCARRARPTSSSPGERSKPGNTYDFRDTLRARDLARGKALKTKVGLTFRYSPAMRYMRELVAEGFVGTPFIFNGYEQNSQWLDPSTPLRQVDPDADPSVMQVSSLEGYGAPIIDLAHVMVGSDLAEVVGTMRNFIPERMVRATGRMMHMNIDDGDIFVGEFKNGALCSIQTSFVTIGNYPGIEARLYGSEGAIICRLVEEAGICETLKAAKPDQVEFRDLAVPDRFYPAGGSPRESWRTLFYANLIASFIGEIRGEVEGNEGDFADGAWIQEVINAVETSFRERRWISLPLAR
jgi:predicted dehydrogenase